MSILLSATRPAGCGGPPAASRAAPVPQSQTSTPVTRPPHWPRSRLSVSCSAGISGSAGRIGPSDGTSGTSGTSSSTSSGIPSRWQRGPDGGTEYRQGQRRQGQQRQRQQPARSPAGAPSAVDYGTQRRPLRDAPHESYERDRDMDEQGEYGRDAEEERRSGARGPGLPEVDLISSPSNAYVKHLVRLRSSAPYRREMRRVVLVGAELLHEAAGDSPSPLPVRLLLLPEGAAPPRRVVAERVVRATEAVLKKVSGVESAGGVDAVAELDLPPERSLAQLLDELRGASSGETSGGDSPSAAVPSASGSDSGSAPARPVRLLVLDGVQDPGNLGSLARSALAFGWGGLLLLPGCCDPLNDKAVRASRGALLRLPTAAGSLGELAEAAEGRPGLLLLSADMEEGAEGEGAAAGGVGRGGASGAVGLLESGGLLALLQGQGQGRARPEGEGSAAVAGGDSRRGAAVGESSGAAGGSLGPAGSSWGPAVAGREVEDEQRRASQHDPGAGAGAGARPDEPSLSPGPGCPGGVALVLGSEGSGLSPAVRRMCSRVSVPMEGAMESLNVGVAGAILMFALSSGPPQLFAKLATRLQRAAGPEGAGAEGRRQPPLRT
ncbi:hypothetical protein PLESTF_001914900 [Pleodorina starrii]|nr:hypothetical protein PLESTF_001914900 [Pleodorina starrii]